MYKHKLLPVIAAIMITSMAVSLLSFSATTVKASPGATLLPSSARANTGIMFTVTVTNTYTTDNIDNVRVYFTSGFSRPVSYSDNLVQAAGNIENAVPYIKQAGENLKLAEDNKKSSGPNIKQAAENLDLTSTRWPLENVLGTAEAEDNIGAKSDTMPNIVTRLKNVADAIDNDYENLVYIRSQLDSAGRSLMRASGKILDTPNDGRDNLDNFNEAAAYRFYGAGEHLMNAAVLCDNGAIENIGTWIDNAGALLSTASTYLYNDTTKVYVNDAGANLRTAGRKLIDAGNFIDNAGYALDLAVTPLSWAAENLCVVSGLGTTTAGDNAGDNLRFVARYIDNAGMALRDLLAGPVVFPDPVNPDNNVDNIYRAGENLRLAAANLNNVANWLGVDLGKDNENAAALDLYQAADNLRTWDLLNLTTAGNELVSMGTNLLAGAAKMKATASSLTPTTWTMSSGAENVEFSSIGDNIIAPAGSQTFKFLWVTPNITTETDYLLSVVVSKEQTTGQDLTYPHWENLGGFTVRIDGAVPTVTINVTQAGVATTNLVGNKLDNARATITIVASEVLSSIENVYIMNAFRQDNILPPIPGSSFTTTDSITWTYQYLTIGEWDDNFTWVRLSKAVDVAGNENRDTANDNIGMENSLTVDTRAPIFADNGLRPTGTGIRVGMLENRVQPGTGKVYRWLDNTAAKNLFIIVGDNVVGTGNDLGVTSVTVNAASATRDPVGENLWTTSMTLPEGYTAAVVVTATDRTGNTRSENIESIFVDTQFPQITFETITRKVGPISWTENGILISDNTPTIKVKIIDPGYPTTGWGVARDNLKVIFDNNDNIVDAGRVFGWSPYSWENLENNVAWDVSTGIFENTIENTAATDKALVSGTYWINVMATDNLWHGTDNKKIASRSFTIDVTKPTTASIVFAVTYTTSPADPQKQKLTTLPISGEVGELGGVIKVYVAGALAYTSDALTSLEWSASVTLTAGTTQRVQVTYTDVAGNESDKKDYGYFLADGTAPTVTISSPVTGASTDKTSIQITGSVGKDTWEDFADLTVRIQVGGAAPGTVTLDANGNFTTSATLGEGTNVITITATDAVGNVGSGSVSVERTVAPLTTYAIIIVIVALILAAIAIFVKR